MKKSILGFAVLGLALANAAMASGSMPMPEEQFAASGFYLGADVGYGFLATPEYNIFNIPDRVVHELVEHHLIENMSESRSVGDFVWGVNVGYDFAISPKAEMGIEIGYKDLGKSKYNSSFQLEGDNQTNQHPDFDDAKFSFERKIAQQAVDVLLTGHYYVYQGLNVFAKAGAAYVGSKTTQNMWVYADDNRGNSNDADFDMGTSQSIWRLRPELALGVGYSFSKNLDLHVMYDYINGSDVDNGYLTVIPYSPAKIYSSNMVTVGMSWKFAN